MIMETWLNTFWGDFADRFAHRYSFVFFAASAIFLGVNQQFGSGTTCWTPAQFTDQWTAYTEEYCRIENTYYLPLSNSFLQDYGQRRSRQLATFHWTPIFLLLAAVSFLVPGFCWTKVAGITAIPFLGLTEAAREAAGLGGSARSRAFRSLAGRLRFRLFRQNPLNVLGIILYLLLKISYIYFWYWQFDQVNNIFQTDHHYPIRVLQNIRNGTEWEGLAKFPQVTMCDFEVRVLGNVHHHTVQCALSANQLVPFLAVLIYCWLFIGGVLALVSAAVWIATAVVSVVSPCRCLLLGPLVAAAEGGSIIKSDLRQFLSELPSDAVFLLRLIQTRVGDLPAQEVVSELWSASQYGGAEGKKWRPIPPDDDDVD